MEPHTIRKSTAETRRARSSAERVDDLRMTGTHYDLANSVPVERLSNTTTS